MWLLGFGFDGLTNIVKTNQKALPFRNKGWPPYQRMKELMPSKAKGGNAFRPGVDGDESSSSSSDSDDSDDEAEAGGTMNKEKGKGKAVIELEANKERKDDSETSDSGSDSDKEVSLCLLDLYSCLLEIRLPPLPNALHIAHLHSLLRRSANMSLRPSLPPQRNPEASPMVHMRCTHFLRKLESSHQLFVTACVMTRTNGRYNYHFYLPLLSGSRMLCVDCRRSIEIYQIIRWLIFSLFLNILLVQLMLILLLPLMDYERSG